MNDADLVRLHPELAADAKTKKEVSDFIKKIVSLYPVLLPKIQENLVSLFIKLKDNKKYNLDINEIFKDKYAVLFYELLDKFKLDLDSQAKLLILYSSISVGFKQVLIDNLTNCLSSNKKVTVLLYDPNYDTKKSMVFGILLIMPDRINLGCDIDDVVFNYNFKYNDLTGKATVFNYKYLEVEKNIQRLTVSLSNSIKANLLATLNKEGKRQHNILLVPGSNFEAFKNNDLERHDKFPLSVSVDPNGSIRDIPTPYNEIIACPNMGRLMIHKTQKLIYMRDTKIIMARAGEDLTVARFSSVIDPIISTFIGADISKFNALSTLMDDFQPENVEAVDDPTGYKDYLISVLKTITEKSIGEPCGQFIQNIVLLVNLTQSYTLMPEEFDKCWKTIETQIRARKDVNPLLGAVHDEFGALVQILTPEFKRLKNYQEAHGLKKPNLSISPVKFWIDYFNSPPLMIAPLKTALSSLKNLCINLDKQRDLALKLFTINQQLKEKETKWQENPILGKGKIESMLQTLKGEESGLKSEFISLMDELEQIRPSLAKAAKDLYGYIMKVRSSVTSRESWLSKADENLNDLEFIKVKEPLDDNLEKMFASLTQRILSLQQSKEAIADFSTARGPFDLIRKLIKDAYNELYFKLEDLQNSIEFIDKIWSSLFPSPTEKKDEYLNYSERERIADQQRKAELIKLNRKVELTKIKRKTQIIEKGFESLKINKEDELKKGIKELKGYNMDPKLNNLIKNVELELSITEAEAIPIKEALTNMFKQESPYEKPVDILGNRFIETANAARSNNELYKILFTIVSRIVDEGLMFAKETIKILDKRNYDAVRIHYGEMWVRELDPKKFPGSSKRFTKENLTAIIGWLQNIGNEKDRIKAEVDIKIANNEQVDYDKVEAEKQQLIDNFINLLFRPAYVGPYTQIVQFYVRWILYILWKNGGQRFVLLAPFDVKSASENISDLRAEEYKKVLDNTLRDLKS